MRRLTALFVILLSLNISCKIPPFNEEISRLFLLTSDMEEEAKVGPVDLGGFGMEQISLLKFIPTKDFFDEGFLIIDITDLWIGFITGNNNLIGLMGDPMVEEVTDFSNGNKKELNYLAETIPASGPQMTFINIYLLAFPPPFQQRLNVFEFDHLKFPPGEDLEGRIEGDMAPNLIDLVVGADIYPDFVTDKVYFLCSREGFPNEFYEIRYDSDAVGLAVPSPVRPSLPPPPGYPIWIFPDAPENCFYFHYEPLGFDGTSIAQYWIGSGWRTLKWDNFDLPFPVEITIPHRIEALLTTGQLFCVDDETAYVYDLDGALQYTIELGDMRFVYEQWDGDRFKVIFVLPYYVDYGDEKGFVFKVYSIDTDDLGKLVAD